MAYSKCPKCESTSFEVQMNSPLYSNFKLSFVQCSKCGCVIGAMDYENIGRRIDDLEKKIDNISSSNFKTQSINNSLEVINQNINTLFKYIKSKF